MAEKSKSGQKRTKRKRGFYVPDAERMKIVTLHLAGKSYREIAKATGRDKSTVQRIVHDSPELRLMNESVVEGYRMEMLGVLRDAMDSVRRLVRDDNPKAVLAREVL